MPHSTPLAPRQRHPGFDFHPGWLCLSKWLSPILRPRIGPWLDKQLSEGIENWSNRQAQCALILGAHPTGQSLPGIHVLSRCARIGNDKLISWLCAFEADPEQRGSNDWRAIHHASMKGHAPAIAALHEAGADFEAQEANGWTPLMIACKENRIESVLELSRLGADPNCLDARGETPLLLCSRHGFEESAKILIAAGAYVDATERRGFQAIHLAAAQGHDGICMALLEAGASPEAAGPWSKTPASLAKAEGHLSTLALLEKAAFEITFQQPQSPERSLGSTSRRL